MSKKDWQEIETELELQYKNALRRDELRNRRLNRQFKIFAGVLAVYVFAAIIALFIVNGGKLPSIFSGRTVYYGTDDSKSIEEANSRIDKLEESLKKSGNPDLAALSARQALLESRQEAVSETVLEDADKALTAKLLREKQKNLEASIEDLKADNARLNEKIDSFISNVLTVPIIGFFLTLLVGLGAGLFNWIKAKKPSEKSGPKEVTVISSE